MKEFAVAVAIVIIILSIVFGPLGLIWSLNALFPSLAIPYTFKTWFASVFLTAIFGPFRVYTSSK